MPTLEQKFTQLAEANGLDLTKPDDMARVRADFNDTYGIPVEAVSGSTDWDTFMAAAKTGALPTLAASYSPVGPLDDAILKQSLAEAKKPDAAEYVELPSSGEPEAVHPPDEAERMRRTSLLETAQAAGGLGAGALSTAVAKGVRALGVSVPGVTPQVLEAAAGPSTSKAREEIAKIRKKDIEEKSIPRRILEDAGNIVLGLPNLAATALGGFEIPKGADPYEVGFKAGEALTPMLAAGAIEAVTSPVETFKKAPITTLLTVIPAARAAVKLGGATKAGQAAGSFLRSAREQIAKKLTPEWLRSKGLTRQTFFDLYDAGDPEVSALLEDLYQNIPEKVAAAERVVPEIRAAAEVAQRAKDVAPPGVTATVGLAGRAAAEAELAEKTGVPMRPTSGSQTFGIGDEPPRELPPYQPQEAAARGISPETLMAERAAEAGDIAEAEARRAIRVGREQQQAQRAAQLAAEDAANFPSWLGGQPNTKTPHLLPINQVVGKTANGNDISILRLRKSIQDKMADDPTYRPTKQERYIASMETARIGGESYLVSPQVKLAHDWSTGIAEAGRQSENTLSMLGKQVGTFAKQVALPMSPKAILNNIIGNEFLTATANGSAPILTGSPGVKKAIDYTRYFKKSAAERRRNPDAFFDAIEETGLVGSDVIEQDIKSLNLLQSNPVANLGGKAMQVGDQVYKLEVAKNAWDQAKGLLGLLKPGESVTLRTSPRISHVITKDQTGWVAKRAGSNRAPIRLTEKEVDKLVARHGSWKAKTLYFDYGGDLPAWMRSLRKAPVISAVSPYTTWAFRALDVPGLKPGLGSAVFAGGPAAGISTTSKAGALRLAAADARTAMGRAALLSAMPNQTDDERTLRDAFAYIPGQDRSKVISVLTDPGATATANFSSADWLGPTLSLWSGVATALDRTITGTDDMLLDYARAAEQGARPGEEEKFAREQRRRLEGLIRRARSQDTATAVLGATGLAGSILMDTYGKMLDSERAGSDFNWYDASKSMFIPRAGVAVAEGLREALGGEPEDRLIGAPADPKSRDSKLQWMMSQVFGLGWKTIDSTKTAERYANSVASELQAQADLWKRKKLAEVAEMEGTGMAEERQQEILQEYERIKGAISDAKALALSNYEQAYGRLIEQKEAQMKAAVPQQKAGE